MLKKKRKTEGTFKDVVQLDLPLWGDLFSVIFQYTPDFTKNCLLRSSKRFLEIVKKRAVFTKRVTFYVNEDWCTRIFGDFFFSSIYALFGEEEVKMDTVGPHFFRQRFLKSVEIGDLRLLCRKDSHQRLLFPYLERVCIIPPPCNMKEEEAAVTSLCDFVQTYPRRVSVDLTRFYCDEDIADEFEEEGEYPCSGMFDVNLEKLGNLGKFDEITLCGDMLFSEDCEYSKEAAVFQFLAKLDAKTVVIQGIIGMMFMEVFEGLACCNNVEKVVVVNFSWSVALDFRTFSNMCKIILENDNSFRNVKEIVFQNALELDSEATFAQVTELVRKKSTLEKIVIRPWLSDNMQGLVPALERLVGLLPSLHVDDCEGMVDILLDFDGDLVTGFPEFLKERLVEKYLRLFRRNPVNSSQFFYVGSDASSRSWKEKDTEE